MDQIRKAMLWLKQYHFWVLSVLIAIIGLVCWKLGAAKLSKEYVTNTTTIKGAFNNVKTFLAKPFHPNDEVNQKQLEQIELQSKNVEAIWNALYERQSKSVLSWPKPLGEKFRDFIVKRRFGDPIPRDLRDTYRDYIDQHFESLPKRISARPLGENEQGGGGEGYSRSMTRGAFRGEGGAFRMGEGGSTTPVGQDDDYLCEWLDQALVREELNFPTTPSAMKIWVTQENLWVYHTLLDIIANTNEAAHADRMTNAAVRAIIALEVGQPAAQASMERGRVEILAGPSAAPVEGEAALGMEGGGGERPVEGGGMFPGGGYSERGAEGGAGSGMSEEQENAILVQGRYLDPATGKPAGMGAPAVGAEGGDPAAAAPAATIPTGPYKQLPIRMVLKMDQRWLNHLIAECASQPLPVEVKEVRINPTTGVSVGGGEGSYRGGGGMGATGGSGSSYQPPIGDSTAGVATFKQHPELATVVIQGIVTIYNEPDPSQLKVDTGEQMVATE